MHVIAWTYAKHTQNCRAVAYVLYVLRYMLNVLPGYIVPSADILSPVRDLVAHRHLSVKAAQNAKLRPRCRQRTHEKDVSRFQANAMLASKSYFGTERFIWSECPEARSLRSSRRELTPPQGAQLMALTEAPT
jgi:hypothetical protein